MEEQARTHRLTAPIVASRFALAANTVGIAGNSRDTAHDEGEDNDGNRDGAAVFPPPTNRPRAETSPPVGSAHFTKGKRRELSVMAPSDTEQTAPWTARIVFYAAAVLAAVAIGLQIAGGDPSLGVIFSLTLLISVYATIRYGKTSGSRTHGR